MQNIIQFNIKHGLFGNYTFNAGAKYEYIEENSLSPEIKIKIIEYMENTNHIPNHFLNFVYETYLDHLKAIYQGKIKDNDDSKTGYIAGYNITESHKKNKFGIIIKHENNKKKKPQLVLFCSKDPSLYEQFFLKKALKEEKYNRNNLNFSLPPSKVGKSANNSVNENKINNPYELNPIDCNIIKSSEGNQSVELNKININENSIDANPAKNENGNQEQILSTKLFEKENEVDKFIRGYAFECEVCGYLRNKICSIKGNIELPDVFYSLKDVKVNNIKNKEKSYFYHEFDSVFYLGNDVEFDKNLFRINCKYENSSFENTKRSENSDVLTIKRNSLLFVECKETGDFNSVFFELFKNIYKYKNILDYIFKLKGYSIKILYLYRYEFIDRNCNFQRFKESVINAINKCKTENIIGVDSYNILAFYTYDSLYLNNYYSVTNELKDVKNNQKKDRELIEKTQRECKELEIKYNQTQEKLGKLEKKLAELLKNQEKEEDLADRKTEKKE